MAKAQQSGQPTGARDPADLYAPVAERVQLKDVRLLQSYAVQRPREGDLPTDLDLAVEVEANFNAEQMMIAVMPRFRVTTGGGGQEKTPEFLRIEATFLLIYTLKSREEFRDEQIAAFGEMNGVYNAWPYWREFVQSMTVRMGLPPLVLPVFRIGATQSADKRRGQRKGRLPKPK